MTRTEEVLLLSSIFSQASCLQFAGEQPTQDAPTGHVFDGDRRGDGQRRAPRRGPVPPRDVVGKDRSCRHTTSASKSRRATPAVSRRPDR